MSDDAATHCLNCEAPLAGRFCAQCGQKDLGTRVDLGELFREFVGEVFEIEGKLPRTLVSVVLAPGWFLYQVLEGRRQSFSNPLRFYLLAAFLCVIVTDWRVDSAARAAAENGALHISRDLNGGLVVHIQSEAPEDDEERMYAVHDLLLELEPPESVPALHLLPWEPTSERDPFDWLSTLTTDITLECVQEVDGFERVTLGIERLIRHREGPDVVVTLLATSLEQLPLVMSGMIAVFAVLLKLFFWRHPASVHVLVSVVLHGLFLYGWTAFMVWPSGWMVWLVSGWLQTHALFSLKAAYQVSWSRTFLSYGVLGGLWLLSAFGGLILALLVALYLLAGAF